MGAYAVNLFYPNWYNFYAPLSRPIMLQVQLLFSIVQLFFSVVQLLFSRYISCPSETKSCSMNKKVLHGVSREVMLTGKVLRENINIQGKLLPHEVGENLIYTY